MSRASNETRSTPLLAPACMTMIASAYAALQQEPDPPPIRSSYVTLFCARAGVAVEARFLRITQTRFPQVRVGVVFRANSGVANAALALQFEQRFANELAALGYEPWPSPTNFDRRFTTPMPVPRPDENLEAFVNQAAEIAAKYATLARALTAFQPCREGTSAQHPPQRRTSATSS